MENGAKRQAAGKRSHREDGSFSIEQAKEESVISDLHGSQDFVLLPLDYCA